MKRAAELTGCREGNLVAQTCVVSLQVGAFLQLSGSGPKQGNWDVHVTPGGCLCTCSFGKSVNCLSAVLSENPPFMNPSHGWCLGTLVASTTVCLFPESEDGYFPPKTPQTSALALNCATTQPQ